MEVHAGLIDLKWDRRPRCGHGSRLAVIRRCRCSSPEPTSPTGRPDNRVVPDVVSDLVVSPRVTIPAGELRWRFSRSSGPGGQGVNTTDSRAELSFDVATSPSVPPFLRERAVSRLADRLIDGVLVVAASEHRSQLRNREAAAARLMSVLRGALAPPPRTRRPTMPSRGAIERRLTDKKATAKRKAERRRPPEW